MTFSFADEYKQWSNEQLFDLLKNKELYQPSAVTAAESEFSSRALGEVEMEFLENQYAEKEIRKQTKFQKVAVKKLSTTANFLLKETDPLIKKTDELRLRVFCYSIGLLILISFAAEFDIIKTMLRYHIRLDPIPLTIANCLLIIAYCKPSITLPPDKNHSPNTINSSTYFQQLFNMKKIKFGAGFTVFVIFFGIATIDAIQSRDWLRVFFWLLTGMVFLVADNLKRPSRQ